jgi:hypothetical protein
MSKGGLTQEDFEKLLRWLDPDRDKAGEKYQKIRLRLTRIFVCRGCYEAEDLADESINVVASKSDWLIENYEGDPALYFYAVAKKIHQGYIKKKTPPTPPPPDRESPEVEQVCDYLDECLEELPSLERNLMLRYHEGDKQEKIQNRKKLAEELKVSRNALRIKVCHLHSRLKECVERRLQAAEAG